MIQRGRAAVAAKLIPKIVKKANHAEPMRASLEDGDMRLTLVTGTVRSFDLVFVCRANKGFPVALRCVRTNTCGLGHSIWAALSANAHVY